MNFWDGQFLFIKIFLEFSCHEACGTALFYLFVYYQPANSAMEPKLFLSFSHCSKEVGNNSNTKIVTKKSYVILHLCFHLCHDISSSVCLLCVCMCWFSTCGLNLSLCMNFPDVPCDALFHNPYLCSVKRVTLLSVKCTFARSLWEVV